MQMSPLWLTLWLIVVVLLLCLCCAVTVWLLRHRRNMQRDRQTARETMLVLHSELMRRRNEARRAQEEAAETREEATIEGLEMLPTQPWRNTMNERQLQGDEECCLCMEAFQETDELRVLPCEHFYHKNCIDRWFAARRYQSRSCPLCKRNPLQEGDEGGAAEGGAAAGADTGSDRSSEAEEGHAGAPVVLGVLDGSPAYSSTHDAAASSASRPGGGGGAGSRSPPESPPGGDLELQSLSDSGDEQRATRHPPAAGAAGADDGGAHACVAQ